MFHTPLEIYALVRAGRGLVPPDRRLSEEMPNREKVKRVCGVRTCLFTTISSRLAGDLNTSSIISNDTFAVSGTMYVAQRYAKKHALPKTPKVILAN